MAGQWVCAPGDVGNRGGKARDARFEGQCELREVLHAIFATGIYRREYSVCHSPPAPIPSAEKSIPLCTISGDVPDG